MRTASRVAVAATVSTAAILLLPLASPQAHAAERLVCGSPASYAEGSPYDFDAASFVPSEPEPVFASGAAGEAPASVCGPAAGSAGEGPPAGRGEGSGSRRSGSSSKFTFVNCLFMLFSRNHVAPPRAAKTTKPI